MAIGGLPAGALLGSFLRPLIESPIRLTTDARWAIAFVAATVLIAIAVLVARLRAWRRRSRRDALEIARLDRELRRRVAELEAIMDLVPVCVSDPACEHITLNARLGTLLGLDAHEDVSRRGDGAAVRPYKILKDGRELPPSEFPMRRAAASATRVDAEELDLQLSDGRTFNLLVTAAPLFDECGVVRGCLGTLVDVTGVRRAEQDVRDRDDLLRVIVDALPALVCYVDRDLRYRLVNHAYERWTGRPPDELLGRSVNDVLDSSMRATAQEHLQHVLAGESAHYEMEMPFHDGVVRCIEIDNVPHMADGEVRGVVSLVHDVTRRRRMEDALSASESEYRASFQLSGVGQAHVDPRTGRFLRVNQRLCEMTGYSEEELLARTFSDITHPDDRAADFPSLVRLMRGETDEHELEKRYVRKDGAITWVRVNVTMIRGADGRPLRSVSVIQDVTAAKRAEAALRATEEHQRLAVEAADLGVWYWDIRTGGLQWNDRFLGMVGLAPGTPMTAPLFVSLLHPDDRTRVLANLHRAIEDRVDYRDEFRCVYPRDGSVHWVLSIGRVLYVADGGAERMIGVALEITERKRDEEALRDADHRKDEFLAMLGHELRNPLVPILNASKLLQLQGPTEPRLVQAREMIDRQVAHMVRLIDDLLDVSRITRGTIALRRRPMLLSACVERALEQVRGVIDGQGQRLVVSLSSDPVWVDADPERLLQVVVNLLTNASKFTPPGGRIGVSTEPLGDGEVLLRVRDTGTGIAHEALPHVFDLFFQEQNTIDRAQGGLGIGLTLVKTVVELHGGRVEVSSGGHGQGAEFVVVLPCLPHANPFESLPSSRRRTAACRPMRVVIVEDNVDAALSFQKLLELHGHEVRVAYDGIAALLLAGTYVADVAFIDIGLPGLDGYQLARRLRETSSYAGATLIAVSGYGRDDDKRRAAAAGFDRHLTKPVDMDTVCALLAGIGVDASSVASMPAQ